MVRELERRGVVGGALQRCIKSAIGRHIGDMR